MMQFLFGIIFIATGVVVTWKARWMYENFGAVAWAEAKLHSTTFFYQLVGVIIVIVGLLIMGGDVQVGLAGLFGGQNTGF